MMRSFLTFVLVLQQQGRFRASLMMQFGLAFCDREGTTTFFSVHFLCRTLPPQMTLLMDRTDKAFISKEAYINTTRCHSFAQSDLLCI